MPKRIYKIKKVIYSLISVGGKPMHKTKKRRKRRVRIKNIVILIALLTSAGYLGIMGAKLLLTFDQATTKTNASETNNSLHDLPSNYQEVFTALQDTYDDHRIQKMMNTYTQYPISILTLLSRNEDTFDFVYEYPNREEMKIENLKKAELQNGIPLLQQWDQRWGYQIYGDDVMGLTGCGPTALSMIVTYFTKDTSLTPGKLADIAYHNGYYVKGQGTMWTMFEEVAKLYDIHCTYVSLSTESITNELSKNHPVILSVTAGDFTQTGHFIVLCGFYKNGSVIVHDPNSKTRSEKHWDLTTLLDQSVAGWAFYKN